MKQIVPNSTGTAFTILKISDDYYLWVGRGVVSCLGVDKTVDTFVPLTGFRRRGKLYGTGAKAFEYS